MDPSTQADAQTLGQPSKHDWKLGCFRGSGAHSLVAKSAAFEAPQAAPSKHTVVTPINVSCSTGCEYRTALAFQRLAGIGVSYGQGKP